MLEELTQNEVIFKLIKLIEENTYINTGVKLKG